MKFTKESESHKQKDNNEIVPDADFAVDLAGSKLTSVALSIWYICATSMGMSETDGSVTQLHRSGWTL